MTKVALLDPLAVIDGRPALFLRDNFGGEVPLSCPYPPLELLFTAALLRDNGIDVQLIAANVKGLKHEAVAKQLSNDPPDLVLVPSAWGSLLDDFRLFDILKQAIPGSQLIISGPNVTSDPERPLQESVVDFVIMGEPEEAMLRLALGEAPSTIPNLAYRNDDVIERTERRLPPGFADYPLPARDLIDLHRYIIPFSRRLPSTTIATTRGCAHTCTFCPTQIWHQRVVRERPVELVMEEIEQLVKVYGIRELNIRDDTFTGNRDRVIEICEGILKRGYDLTWRCFGSASTVDKNLLQLMSTAGCIQVCYGFESGDDKVLRKTGKGTTVDQGRQAARWTHDAGMEVSGTFIVGLEGDSSDSVNRSIAFARKNALDYVQVNVAVPMPGTGFGKRRKRQGIESTPENFRWYGAQTSEAKQLAREDLPKEVRRFYREFYLRPGYVWGRLASKRGLVSLASHARLGLRMLRYVGMQ